MTIPFVACMASVAAFYGLPPRVLPAINGVEHGWVGAVHENSDGSQDLGVMQVNTRWVQPLAHYTGSAADVVKYRLIYDACFNIAAAGAIMRIYMNETHDDLMLAIGDYHSHTPARNRSYQEKVVRSAGSLFGTTTNEREASVAAPGR